MTGLQQILTVNPVPVTITRVRDGTVLYANPACLELLGYDEREFVGFPLEGLNFWVHPVAQTEILRQVKNGDRVRRRRERIRGKGGREFEVLASIEPLGCEGEPCLVGFFCDVTEQVRGEHERQVLGQRLAALLDAAGDGIYAISIEGRCTLVNQAAATALGYERRELVDQMLHDVVHNRREDGSPYPAAECPSTRTLHHGESSRVTEEVLWRRDGTSLPVEYTSFPIYDDDEVAGAVIVFRDMTHRRNADAVISEQIQALRDQAELIALTHDAIMVRDVEGRISFWNKGAERIYGWSREDAVGRLSDDLLRTELPEPGEEINAGLERYGQWDGRLTQQTRDGRRVEVASRWSLRRVDGRPDHVLEINVDVTAKAMAERERAVAQEEAERANRAKSEFLSRMSHELRTPLNAVLGFAQLLEIEDPRPDQREAVSQITGAARHLLELINEVLDLSRIESGTMTLSLEHVRLGDAVGDALGMLAPLAVAAGVDVFDHTEAVGHLHVRADRQRLKQVLLNLVSNAIKYNREHGEVHIRCYPAGPRRVRIVIDDTGIGMTSEDIERLFVPFQRLGPATTSVEGTGLGLALTRRLVELMGGTVGVRSAPGQGSSFSVELWAAEAVPEQARMIPGNDASAPATGGRAAVVLYVEDNLANVRLVERILARRPHVELLVAMQGSMALTLARQHHPSLILLDLHLPDMPGQEVLRRLRADPATAAASVVVVSADATPGHVERVLRSGADDYLTKPFDLTHFLAIIDNLGAAPDAKARAAPGPSSR